MAKILSYTIFAFAVVTLCAAGRIARNGLRERITRMCFCTIVASSWWSLFFGLMINTTDTDAAAWLRGCGQIGMFAFLICCSYVLVAWSGITGAVKTFLESFAWLGVAVYPFTVLKSNIHYELTDYGMSYQMQSGLWSYAYNLYCVVAALNLGGMVIYMLRHSKHKRDKIVAYDLLMSVFITFFGCVLDTVMPTLGITAFPGSTIGQFVGTMVLYRTYVFYEKLQITPENVSQFVYYCVDEPVLLFNEKEQLCMVNNGATSFLEKEEEECRAFRLEELFELRGEAFRFRGDKNRMEGKCRFNDRECILCIDKIHDNYHEITGYIVLVHDITERVRNMQQLKQEKERADRANEAKSVFLANMSHEIRTPINAIMGLDEMILRECQEEEVQEYAQNIQNASRTLLALINDILDFSKIESGRMELVQEAYSLKNMLKNLESECQMRAEQKGLWLRFEVPEETPGVLLGDEIRMKQVLLNLLTNAIKYTKQGGVTLTVKSRMLGEDEAEFSYAVKDTGIGIREEDLDGMFEMFSRGDEQRVHGIEGTGLGLTIVERIVRLMDGTIQVESECDRGSVFTVCLRQKVMGLMPVGALHENESGKKRKKYVPAFRAPEARLLAVDDNKVNLTVIKGLLRETQMKVTCAMSGKECLELVRKNRYDMILLDHMMPEMDGIETLAHLKTMEDNQSAEAAMIVLTANAMAGVREMYLEKGFDDYIAKPVDGEELEKLLVQYLPPELVRKEGG